MSVHPYRTADGTRYQVRWREGKRARTRSFASKRDANAYDIDVKARRQRGEALPRPGRETVAGTYDQWLRLYAPNLAKSTLEVHQSVWNAHVKGRFDHHPLSELVSNPQLIDELVAEMTERGVGREAQRRTLAVLSSVMSAAVRWNKIAVNPVLSIVKPPKARKRIPHPLPPLIVERIRLHMLRRRTLDDTRQRNWADACLVELMAYAGLRPGEALALHWDDIGSNTLSIDKAISVGEEAPTKTRRVRTVPLVAALADDLDKLRTHRHLPSHNKLIFPTANGDPWSRSQYRNWRRRIWKPALKGLAEGEPPQPSLAKVIPYDCRASFVSLHLRAGENPLEVAEWAGHSPQVMFEHYAGVIKELRGEPNTPVAEQIDLQRKAVLEMTSLDLDILMIELVNAPMSRVLRQLPGYEKRREGAKKELAEADERLSNAS